MIPVHAATEYVYLIYVIKHLQYFDIQSMLNYWFLTNGRVCIWLLFQLSRQVGWET